MNQACRGIFGAHPSRGIALLSTQEMVSPLQMKKQDVTVPDGFVKIKRGKYQGDLAHSLDAMESGGVCLKFIPQRTDPERILQKNTTPTTWSSLGKLHPSFVCPLFSHHLVRRGRHLLQKSLNSIRPQSTGLWFLLS